MASSHIGDMDDLKNSIRAQPSLHLSVPEIRDRYRTCKLTSKSKLTSKANGTTLALDCSLLIPEWRPEML